MSYFAFTKFSETWGLYQPLIGNLSTYVFHSEKVQESLMTTHQPLTEKPRHICEKLHVQRSNSEKSCGLDYTHRVFTQETSAYTYGTPRLLTACMLGAHTI